MLRKILKFPAQNEVSQFLDINAPDLNSENKEAPLHKAVQDPNNLKIVKLLLAHGANVNFVNNYRSTPLHWAVQIENNEQIIEILLEHGANIQAKDKSGSTPLHWAVTDSRDQKKVRLLLKWGADPNTRDNEGVTCLHEAAEVENNAGVLTFLAQNGGDISARDDWGRTPLYMAVRKGYSSNVKTLLDMNADVYCTAELIEELLEKAIKEDNPLVQKATYIFLERLNSLIWSNSLSVENLAIWKSTMISHSRRLENLFHDI